MAGITQDRWIFRLFNGNCLNRKISVVSMNKRIPENQREPVQVP